MKAFIILGPESSGTRYMTRLFIQAGCYGDRGHSQRLDKYIPEVSEGIVKDHKALVWRRSLPHGSGGDKGFPDIVHMKRTLEFAGYDAYAIVMVRDWSCMLQSQVDKRSRVGDYHTASQNTREAYNRIFMAMHFESIPYFMVTYESMLNKRAVVRLFIESFALPPPQVNFKIVDGNEKYYGGII